MEQTIWNSQVLVEVSLLLPLLIYIWAILGKTVRHRAISDTIIYVINYHIRYNFTTRSNMDVSIQ